MPGAGPGTTNRTVRVTLAVQRDGPGGTFAIYKRNLLLPVERTFAWEDKFKRVLLRFEFKQQRHYGMKLMAYTLINLGHFCGA